VANPRRDSRKWPSPPRAVTGRWLGLWRRLIAEIRPTRGFVNLPWAASGRRRRPARVDRNLTQNAGSASHQPEASARNTLFRADVSGECAPSIPVSPAPYATPLPLACGRASRGSTLRLSFVSYASLRASVPRLDCLSLPLLGSNAHAEQNPDSDRKTPETPRPSMRRLRNGSTASW